MMDMNIEIIPNYHPIFVHFTIGLLSVSALLYLLGSVLKKENLFIAARWNLWIGAVLTVGTVIAGFDAYNSVGHDAASHAAMTDHKSWALPTAGIFLALALWAGWKQRGAKTVSPVFVTIIVLVSGFLAVTGYKGGEVVYRHGIGVMSMPEIHGDGGHEQSLRQAVSKARKAYDIAQQQYSLSVIDFRDVLDAQRTLLESEDQYERARYETLAARVELFRAMGGGWKEQKGVKNGS